MAVGKLVVQHFQSGNAAISTSFVLPFPTVFLFPQRIMKRAAILALSLALVGCNAGASVDADADMDNMDGGAEIDAGADVMVK